MYKYTRRSDLSQSSIYKLLRCEAVMGSVSTRITPTTALAMMREICKVRNKALQGHLIKAKARYQLGSSYFERDVKADLSLFMRTLRRKFKGKLPKCYSDCMIYYKKQQKYFKNLKRFKHHEKKSIPRAPGNTS